MNDLTGIDLQKISYTLVPIDFTFEENAHEAIPEFKNRFLNNFLAQVWIEDYYGKDFFEFEKHYSSAPIEVFQAVLNFQEICQIWHGYPVQTNAHRYVENEHFLLWKITNSHWHYGSYRKWNVLVRHLSGLKNLKVELPDFEIRLTHSNAYNSHGRSIHDQKIWLDGPFGLFIYYKNVHVLTVGFALSENGIMISQVQLAQKKGNRFLFRLPKFYLDWILDIFGRAFPNDPLYLVEGNSAVKAVIDSYGSSTCPLTDVDKERIVNFYNHSLSDYSRTSRRETYTMVFSNVRRTFIKLKNKARKKISDELRNLELCV